MIILIIVFVLGMFVGATFHSLINKWKEKAKTVGKEFANDIKNEIDKKKQ